MKYWPYVMIVFLLVAFVGCQEKAKAEKVEVLDISAFDRKLSGTSNKIVLDVRTPAEYQEGHLQNAVLIDIKTGSFEEDVEKLDKNKPIFVYCASGVRSEKAASILEEKGFKEIYHMDGGLQEWEKEGKPVVKD